MSVHNLITAIIVLFALGAMGFGAYGMFSEEFPSAARIWGPPAARHTAAVDVPDVGVEPIESPRECRHEAGIRDACTHP